MLKDLVKIANSLDQKGLTAEANYLDKIIKLAAEGKTNLELLDDAISTLNALRMEMDSNFGPEPDYEEPAPDDQYATETAWNALEKDFDLD